MRGLGEICECRQRMARYDRCCHMADQIQKKEAAEKDKAEANQDGRAN
jgi:hypothetical protein